LNPDLLRGGRLGKLSPESIDFTESTSFDMIILEPVIKINMAHMVMLAKQGIVDKAQSSSCLKSLGTIPFNLTLDPSLEDVHMNVEAYVSKDIGQISGGQINLAKSRNDQVSTAIRMALRDYLLKIISSIVKVQTIILDKSLNYLDTVMPGYTHLQHAQPVTLAHHLIAYHDALQRDCDRLLECFNRVNMSPLGAAAMASTGMKIDRDFTALLLGFDGLVENSIDAVSSRDFASEAVSDLALTMTDLSRAVEEMVIWSSFEFGVMDIADGYASTSSIMPQKKNAVVAELIRGKSSTVYGDMIAMITMMKALPYSYNIDMQQLTPHLWNSCKITLSSLTLFGSMLKESSFNEKRLEYLAKSGFITATDLADYLAVENRIPFRTAHMIVGKIVRTALEEKRTFKETILDNLSKIIKDETNMRIKVSENEINKILDPKRSVESRKTKGGPNKIMVKNMINNRKKNVIKTKNWASSKRRQLKSSEDKLKETVDEIVGGE